MLKTIRHAWLGDLRRDVMYAMRMLGRAPGFAAAAIVTLAVGIGANTAVFSLVHTVLLAALPVDHPEQLVVVSHSSLERSGGTGFPYLFFRELEDERQLLDGVLSRGGSERVTLGADAGGEPAIGELVSGNFFEVLGVKPAVGRLLARSDDISPGAHPVVVLSHAYWQRRFGGDPAVVGRSVMVSGYPMTVVGVTARGFDGLDPGQRFDLRVPLAMQAEVRRAPLTLQRRTAWELQIVARLKRGVSIERAAGHRREVHTVRERGREHLGPADRAAVRRDGQSNASGVHAFPLEWPRGSVARLKTGNGCSGEGERVSWLIGEIDSGGRQYVFAGRVRSSTRALDTTAGADLAVRILNSITPSTLRAPAR